MIEQFLSSCLACLYLFLLNHLLAYSPHRDDIWNNHELTVSGSCIIISEYTYTTERYGDIHIHCTQCTLICVHVHVHVTVEKFDHMEGDKTLVSKILIHVHVHVLANVSPCTKKTPQNLHVMIDFSRQ